jgi:hypothetical protein
VPYGAQAPYNELASHTQHSQSEPNVIDAIALAIAPIINLGAEVHLSFMAPFTHTRRFYIALIFTISAEDLFKKKESYSACFQAFCMIIYMFAGQKCSKMLDTQKPKQQET